jgi:hypothetical protein
VETADTMDISTTRPSEPPNNTQAAVAAHANKRPSQSLELGQPDEFQFEKPQFKKKANERGELKSVLSHATRALNSITEACSKNKGCSATSIVGERDNSTGSFCNLLYHELLKMNDRERQLAQFKLYSTLMELKFGTSTTTPTPAASASACSTDVVFPPPSSYCAATPTLQLDMYNVPEKFSINDDEGCSNNLSFTRKMLVDATDALWQLP